MPIHRPTGPPVSTPTPGIDPQGPPVDDARQDSPHQDPQGGGRATERVQETAEQAKEKAQETAGQAKEKAQQVAGQAKEKAQEATVQVRGRLREELGKRSTTVGQQVEATAGDLRSIGDELRKRGKEAPAKLAEQGADRVEQLAVYLQTADGDRILADIKGFASSRPWAVVAGGASLGFLASRFLKTRMDERSSQSSAEATSSAGDEASLEPAPTYGVDAPGPAPTYSVDVSEPVPANGVDTEPLPAGTGLDPSEESSSEEPVASPPDAQPPRWSV